MREEINAEAVHSQEGVKGVKSGIEQKDTAKLFL